MRQVNVNVCNNKRAGGMSSTSSKRSVIIEKSIAKICRSSVDKCLVNV